MCRPLQSCIESGVPSKTLTQLSGFTFTVGIIPIFLKDLALNSFKWQYFCVEMKSLLLNILNENGSSARTPYITLYIAIHHANIIVAVSINLTVSFTKPFTPFINTKQKCRFNPPKKRKYARNYMPHKSLNMPWHTYQKHTDVP